MEAREKRSGYQEVAERLFADLIDIRTSYTDPLESLRQAFLCLIAFGFNNPDEYKLFLIASPGAGMERL